MGTDEQYEEWLEKQRLGKDEEGDNVGVPPDRDLVCVCVSCGRDFTLTQGEHDFYVIHGLSLPKRCPRCRKARKDGVIVDALPVQARLPFATRLPFDGEASRGRP